MSPILVCLVVIFFCVFLYKRSKPSAKNYPPGPARLPFVGSYLHLLWVDYHRPYLALSQLKDFYKSPIISFGMGSFNAVVANDYRSCKQVFTNPDVQGRTSPYPALLRTFGEKNGFFGDDGPRWLHMRRQALRALRDIGFGRRSEPFEAVVEDEARSLVDILNATKGEPTKAPQIFFHTLFNLINHLVHGFRIPQEDRDVLTNLGKIGQRIITSTDNTGRLLAIWPWIRFLFPTLSGHQEIVETTAGFEAFIRTSYNRHHEDFDDQTLRDLLDFFLKSKKEFPNWTDEEIMTSVADLMFPNAAVGIVIAFTLAFLAENPAKQQKCQKQIDDVVGRGRLPTLDDRQRLSMVEMSIRESMRIQPLAPLGITHRAERDTTLGGFHIPQDCMVITNLWAMNHDPTFWKDPDTFRPERFLEEGAKDTTFPFGLGKRVCAGETFARQNLFVVVATVLQNFDVKVAVPLDPGRFLNGIAVAPNSDFALRFIPRE